MDVIFIRELRVEALIGFHKRERHASQIVQVDLEIGIPDAAVFASDRVADCIDYEKVTARIGALAAERHYNLVEAFAECIARALIDEFGASLAKVSVAKLGILKDAGLVGVTIERRRK